MGRLRIASGACLLLGLDIPEADMPPGHGPLLPGLILSSSAEFPDKLKVRKRINLLPLAFDLRGDYDFRWCKMAVTTAFL